MASINKLFLTVSLFIVALGPPQTALAQANTYNVVEVCNKGDVNLDYIVFATKSTFLGGEEAIIKGWYTIKQRKCQNVNPQGFQGVTIGFKQTNGDGITGNMVYSIRGASSAGNSKKAPRVICAPINDSVNYKSALGIVRDKYLPPCRDGFAEFQMSFYDKPNDVFPTFNLEPRKSDKLNPWPGGTASPTPPSKQSSERQMSGAEIVARTILGAAQGIEDAKVRKLSSACGNSSLTLAFAFSEEGPAKACDCLSRKIIRGEDPAIVERILSDSDFDEATENLSKDNFTNYLESCISTSTPSRGGTRAGEATTRIQQQKPEMTLEQQAVALFPDPVRPSYTVGPAFNDPDPSRRIQGHMKHWEQLTGQNFLTDHWSMKPREGRNKHGVLTIASTGYGQWPNIYAAYRAAEQTILNSYKTQYYRVATAEEMRQCVRPTAPKKPRACSDPERSFMIPECFQTSNWREPDWCSSGYDRNFHMTGNAKTEHGGQISYGNVVGDCLVRSDDDGSPFVETRSNGKKIRGHFFKDNLLKNAFVAVECGQEWRDFATAVYNARTDQEFVAADPLSVITRNMNDEAARKIDAYNMKTARVMRQRKDWIVQKRSGN